MLPIIIGLTLGSKTYLNANSCCETEAGREPLGADISTAPRIYAPQKVN